MTVVSLAVEWLGSELDLALARLEAAIGLVDHVKASAPPNHAIVAMALAQSPERILDLHREASNVGGKEPRDPAQESLKGKSGGP
jgi:hypothetical protein